MNLICRKIVTNYSLRNDTEEIKYLEGKTNLLTSNNGLVLNSTDTEITHKQKAVDKEMVSDTYKDK